MEKRSDINLKENASGETFIKDLREISIVTESKSFGVLEHMKSFY